MPGDSACVHVGLPESTLCNSSTEFNNSVAISESHFSALSGLDAVSEARETSSVRSVRAEGQRELLTLVSGSGSIAPALGDQRTPSFCSILGSYDSQGDHSEGEHDALSSAAKQLQSRTELSTHFYQESPNTSQALDVTPLPSPVSVTSPPTVKKLSACSNPSAHSCTECREKRIRGNSTPTVQNANISGTLQSPSCSLSTDEHTIVHVCECMSPFEIDRSLAVENLRLERVRDAHAVVLMIAERYGVEKIRDDLDLLTIVYKYDEMMRMFDMMVASISFRRRQSFLRRSRRSSEIPDETHDVSAILDTHDEFPDPACSNSDLSDIDRQLRGMMRDYFSLNADPAPSAHVSPADESWQLAAEDQSGLKIFVRRHSGTTMLHFRLEGIVRSSLINILSVLNEVDLYKEWIPYYTFPLKLGLRDSQKLCAFGRCEQVTLLCLDFPWPMNNRDCCVDVWAADDLDCTKRIFIRINSLLGGETNRRIPMTIPSPSNKTLRLYCEGAVILSPIKPDKTFFEFYWTLDPKIYLNDYILNFFTKVFAKASFNAFCKVCVEASGGEHAHRREKDPLLYRFIEHRIREIELAKSALHIPLNSGDWPSQGSNGLASARHSDRSDASHINSSVKNTAAKGKGSNYLVHSKANHAANGEKDISQSLNCRSSRFAHGFRRRKSASKHEGEK